MWRTPDGDRVLKGAERNLFKQGMSVLVSRIDDDDDWLVGVKVFDQLSKAEKFAILEHVASALLIEGIAAPRLTAVAEGAIAAIYAQLMSNVDFEIDSGDECDDRELVVGACKECELTDDAPSPHSSDSDAWREIIDLLADQILWDRDWAEEWVHPDANPDDAKAVREFARIDADYYSEVAPDPNPTQLEQIRVALAKLCEKGI
ncbi:MAG: hypothetical protein JWO87_1284 [Phycisphaerales bacterium]|nr:hypothetical protein [Phycisphaerales bacterium]